MAVSKGVSGWSLVVWREGNIVLVVTLRPRVLMVLEVVECGGEDLWPKRASEWRVYAYISESFGNQK